MNTNVRRNVAITLITLGFLLWILGTSLLAGAIYNDFTIDAGKQTATARVVHVTPTKAIVEFYSPTDGLVRPTDGLLYPYGVEENRLVTVDYDVRDPQRVRLSGRSWVNFLPPLASGPFAGGGILIIAGVTLQRWPSLHRKFRQQQP